MVPSWHLTAYWPGRHDDLHVVHTVSELTPPAMPRWQGEDTNLWPAQCEAPGCVQNLQVWSRVS
jgi:hypothetical protein